MAERGQELRKNSAGPHGYSCRTSARQLPRKPTGVWHRDGFFSSNEVGVIPFIGYFRAGFLTIYRLSDFFATIP